jgi:hypothetical protein
VAEHIPVLLEGGPCDGKKTTAVRAPDFPLSVRCKGVIYDPTDRTTKDNRLIYTTRASQQKGQGPPPVSDAVPSGAHKAWNGMLRTIFVDAPKELKHAYNARAAIRRLRHRRGLR